MGCQVAICQKNDKLHFPLNNQLFNFQIENKWQMENIYREILTEHCKFLYARCMAKKKAATRVRRSGSPKRIVMSSKKWAIGSVIVLAVAIPITMSLVSQSQDIRQQAETRINSTVITTMPTDILIISVSQEKGNTQQNNSGGKGNTQNGMPNDQKGNVQNPGGGNNQIDGSEDCVTEDTTERSGGGTLRTIIINCDGKNQTDDQSGGDGNDQTIKSGGKDGQIAAPKGGKGTKDGKAGKNSAKQNEGKRNERSNRNWIQQFIDRILGRQGR